MPGQYTLTAVATDKEGNIGTEKVQFNVIEASEQKTNQHQTVDFPSFKQRTRGMSIIKSQHDVKTTGDRLIDILKGKGFTIFARIDHGANAAGVGLSLRPTEVIIFGNPNIGTILMNCAQTHAIDLPQKMLIWLDKEGQVKIGYNNPRFLKLRHKAFACSETVQKVSNALKGLATAAASE